MASSTPDQTALSSVAGGSFPPCSYCLRPMGSVGIKCAECPPNAEFFVCLPCFSCGAEIGSHKNNHDYFVLDAGQFLLFDKPITWTASETLALLDGVEHHGFGNWENVSKCVSSRSPEECASFFIDMFAEGNLSRVFNSNRLDLTIQDHSTVAPPISVLPPVEMTVEEKRELGYYPYRDEFELEYDHPAEQLIADLVFRTDDDEDQIAYKVWQIDRYRLRLANRIRHKAVARDYGLVTVPSTSTSENQTSTSTSAVKRSHKEIKTIETKEQSSKKPADIYSDFEFLKPLSRYKPAGEMKLLLDNLKKEKQLRDRIKQLSNLKRQGVTKLKQEALTTSPKKLAPSSPVKSARKGNSKVEIVESAVKIRSPLRQPTSPNRSPLRARSPSASRSPRPESPSKQLCTRSRASSPVHNMYEDYAPELADMMTERERKMCHAMKMTYKQYFAAKTAILKDYLARRRGVPVKLRYPPGLDPAHRRQIIAMMTDSGWMEDDAN